MNLDIRKRVRSDGVFGRVDKITRPLDRDDSSTGSNDLGKIDSGIPGTGTDIENAAAVDHARFFPAIQNYWAPGAMLDSQSLEFLVVSSENVIALF
jgi:hypothetical protein